MAVDTPVIAHDLIESALTWPIPPFFQLSSPLIDGQARACSVEMLDGTVLPGDLLSVEPVAGTIGLAMTDRVAPHLLSLKNIRSIRLITRLSLIRNPRMTSDVAIDATQVADARVFTLHFRDGKSVTGTTRGFIKKNAGLFLFLPEGEPQQAIRCFFPAQQLLDVRIGPLLGETLVHREQVSARAVAAALKKQEILREEKLGQQLLNVGIVAPEDLKRALRSQKLSPAVKLGELLRQAGVITSVQLAEALKVQAANRRRRLGDILVEMGMVTVRQVHIALADKLGIPFVNVREFRVDPLALEVLSATIARRYQALPLVQVGDSLVVAVENPLAMESIHDLQVLTGGAIVPVIANPEDLRLRIAKEYASLGLAAADDDVQSDGMQDLAGSELGSLDIRQLNVEDLASALVQEKSAPAHTSDTEFDLRVTDNALVRLVNKIIIDAHAQGASDIHIESNSGRANTRIRFRKDGELEDYFDLPPSYSNALISRIKIMANLDISEHRHAQDGKIAFGKVGPVAIDLRVAVVPTSNNREDVVLRILGGVEPLPLEELGFCARDLEELRHMIARSYGLILVCGPTGSGKTTTLHSVLHHINRPDIKIWTAEDPVEITQAGLRQVQINAHIGWTFAAAMRAFLRADPDVIMVGEMRDAETSKIGIEASLTGHLVFSTLHTNSAAESVVRLLDLGMDPFNFADALIGILSQRLARKLCSKCKRPHNGSEAEIAELLEEYCAGTNLDRTALLAQWRKQFGIGDQLVLHEAAGCGDCRVGYKGRIGVYELLSGTPEVKQLARSHGTVPQLVDAARAGGMRLLHQDAIEKLLLGILDRPSARSVSS